MMKLKRYGVDLENGEFLESPTGEWVAYEDVIKDAPRISAEAIGKKYILDGGYKIMFVCVKVEEIETVIRDALAGKEGE